MALLSPNEFVLDGKPLPDSEYRFNNKLLEQQGVERVISEASVQPAGAIGLFNTPGFLWTAEKHGLMWAREFRIEGFNAYRARFGLKPYEKISDFAASPRSKQLSNSYTEPPMRLIYGRPVCRKNTAAMPSWVKPLREWLPMMPLLTF